MKQEISAVLWAEWLGKEFIFHSHNVCITVYLDCCSFSELSETPKSSQISEEPNKLPEVSANAEVSADTSADSDNNPSGPTASALLPDTISSDVEEEHDKTDVADALPLTAEPDA